MQTKKKVECWYFVGYVGATDGLMSSWSNYRFYMKEIVDFSEILRVNVANHAGRTKIVCVAKSGRRREYLAASSKSKRMICTAEAVSINDDFFFLILFCSASRKLCH